MIQENSYWYVELIEEEEILKACCEECHKANEIKGWFWEGSKYGYAYDMNCSVCNKVLSLRGVQ